MSEALITYEYKGKDGKPEKLVFAKPGFVLFHRVRGIFKHRLAQFTNTELSKRLETKRKELEKLWKAKEPSQDNEKAHDAWLAERPTVEGDLYWQLADGCPEDDFIREANLEGSCIQETIGQLREWWVDGKKVDKTPEQLQEEFGTFHSARLTAVLTAARYKVFTLGDDN